MRTRLSAASLRQAGCLLLCGALTVTYKVSPSGVSARLLGCTGRSIVRLTSIPAHAQDHAPARHRAPSARRTSASPAAPSKTSARPVPVACFGRLNGQLRSLRASRGTQGMKSTPSLIRRLGIRKSGISAGHSFVTFLEDAALPASCIFRPNWASTAIFAQFPPGCIPRSC